MRKISQRPAGFTVIEITIALGVIAIALVSAAGLLGLALDSTRAASNDTNVSAMSARVVSQLRSVPFDALWDAEPGKEPPAAGANLGDPADSRYFFSSEGTPLEAKDGVLPADALYECTVIKTPDVLTQNPQSQHCNRLNLELVFTWPVQSNPDPKRRPNLTTLHASIARY